MGRGSAIEWTDHTFNPWRGCVKVSAGCANCYAETLSKRNPKSLGVWGANGVRVVAAEAYWREPVKWNAEAQAAGERRRVFCASLADVFEDWRGNMSRGMVEETASPAVMWHRDDIGICDAGQNTMGHVRGERLATMADVRRRLCGLIEATPWLDWLLVTKRPENAGRMLEEAGLPATERRNLWLGASVENQPVSQERVEDLLRTEAAIHFLSMEPLLGPVDIRWNLTTECVACRGLDLEDPCIHCGPTKGWIVKDGIDWVIAGGESGPGARPMHPAWATALRDQCQSAEVAFHFKQWGEWEPMISLESWLDGIQEFEGAELRQMMAGTCVVARDGRTFKAGAAVETIEAWRKLWDEADARDEDADDYVVMHRVGKKVAGRLLDGRTWDEFPEVEKSAKPQAADGRCDG